jgi:hypothetical protein
MVRRFQYVTTAFNASNPTVSAYQNESLLCDGQLDLSGLMENGLAAASTRAGLRPTAAADSA